MIIRMSEVGVPGVHRLVTVADEWHMVRAEDSSRLKEARYGVEPAAKDGSTADGGKER